MSLQLSDLDVESLPKAEVQRLFIELGQDGLGRPMAVPVLALRGARPGPVVVLTAAMHGDELNGIPVLHQLFARTNPQTLRGTLVGVIVVNLPGFTARRRMFTHRADLNHRMPGQFGGDEAHSFAAHLMDRIVSKADRLFDLHTASAGRVNCLYVRADMDHPVAARMARLQRPRVILHDPPTDGTLRGAASSLGIPAITLEIGDPRLFQPRFVRRALAGIRAVLGAEKVIPRRPPTDLPEPIVCRRSAWLYTERGGLLTVLPKVGERVKAGEVIAEMTTIFGEPLLTYPAPSDGVVIGKSTDPVAPTGSRILHLGETEVAS
jgi:predicted deacylase